VVDGVADVIAKPNSCLCGLLQCGLEGSEQFLAAGMSLDACGILCFFSDSMLGQKT